ncbi:Hypothetical protein, putative [Bodo saltans]|uniref:Uncharacterized protein n=1 Tax=Bodo saltans TaxID=75058 RepID=A0A0S4JKN8_BODSA|nr:Hypothetical protein, putative [Bodo saltans]|eukprot:CUG90486.1 Hypothetical protein, putative [Bodo saltans]
MFAVNAAARALVANAAVPPAVVPPRKWVDEVCGGNAPFERRGFAQDVAVVAAPAAAPPPPHEVLNSESAQPQRIAARFVEGGFVESETDDECSIIVGANVTPPSWVDVVRGAPRVLPPRCFIPCRRIRV